MLNSLHIIVGTKYVPPHLRNRGGGSSTGGDSFGSDPAPTSRSNYGSGGRGGYDRPHGDYGRRQGGYGGRGGGGYNQGGGNGGEPSEPRTNSRWDNVDMSREARGGGGYGGGGGRGGGYGRGYGGGGGGYRGGQRGGPRVNERGFHGDTRPDPRLERQLFDRDDQQTTGINFDRYDNIPVEVSGNDIPHPVDSYTIDTVGEDLMRNSQLCGFIKPTPVQKYSIPIGAAGRDLMAW